MNNSEEKKAEDEAIKNKMGAIRNKILIMSGKGGVGKSTVAVNLALAMAMRGHKTGILDIDLHGPNVARMLGITELKPGGEEGAITPVQAAPNLTALSMALLGIGAGTPLIWRGPLKSAAIRQMLGEVNWGTLDYLFLDSPPGTGDELLTAVQSIPGLTGAIVVATPQEVALDDARRSVAFAESTGVKVLGIVENMSGFFCPHCGKETRIFKKGGAVKLAEEKQLTLLGSIPISPEVPEMADEGKSIFTAEGKAQEVFKKMAEQVEAICQN